MYYNIFMKFAQQDSLPRVCIHNLVEHRDGVTFSRALKVLRPGLGAFFKEKCLLAIFLASIYDEIETKFGTWTDFTMLNIFK